MVVMAPLMPVGAPSRAIIRVLTTVSGKSAAVRPEKMPAPWMKNFRLSNLQNVRCVVFSEMMMLLLLLLKIFKGKRGSGLVAVMTNRREA